jgi:hypothetical protein
MPELVNTTARPIWCGNVRLIPGQSAEINDTWMKNKRMSALLDSGAVKPAAEAKPVLPARQTAPTQQTQTATPAAQPNRPMPVQQSNRAPPPPPPPATKEA